ncbi:hypothetical protein D3C75_1168120 [compost metagenome]
MVKTHRGFHPFAMKLDLQASQRVYGVHKDVRYGNGYNLMEPMPNAIKYGPYGHAYGLTHVLC